MSNMIQVILLAVVLTIVAIAIGLALGTLLYLATGGAI